MDTETLKAAGTPVYDRIRAVAKAAKRYPVDFALKLFALERFLVRVQASPLADRLVLKGGMLLLAMPSDLVRTTDDLDMSSHARFSLEAVKEAIRAAAAIEPPQPDGLTFELDDAKCAVMGRDPEHSSIRTVIRGRLHTRYAPIDVPVKMDISALDGPHMVLSRVTMPASCKGFEPPTLPSYAWEQVLADKIHACHRHGMTNLRLRDYYDIIKIGRSGLLDADLAARALVSTMRYGDNLAIDPETPALSLGYAEANHATWAKMLKAKGMKGVSTNFRAAMEEVRAIVLPVMAGAAAIRKECGHTDPAQAGGGIGVPF